MEIRKGGKYEKNGQRAREKKTRLSIGGRPEKPEEKSGLVPKGGGAFIKKPSPGTETL